MTSPQQPPAHDTNDPHGDQPLLVAGEPLASSSAALVLVHGRGGTPEGMLPIARAAKATHVALLAPRAAGNAWCPHRFLAPFASNEPHLSSALASIDRAVRLAESHGISRSRIVLAGFSQGACLSMEYVSRNGTRYGGVAAFAGALMGSDTDTRVEVGTLDGTPIVLACGDADEFIPVPRVHAAAAALTGQGAMVDERIYPGVGHSIVGDQLAALRAMIEQLST